MKELSIAAKTAKAIREELKQVFPEMKLSPAGKMSLKLVSIKFLLKH